MKSTTLIWILLVLVLIVPASLAADPPTLINYQGVLRDAADKALDGAYDMVFRFYDASAGGVEVLVDEHRATGTGSVTASNGLFNVELGGGSVSDGGGPGSYSDLGQVFRDYSSVWVEITIDTGAPEVLSPRIHVVASGYALNALNAQDAVDAQNATSSNDAAMLGGVAPSGYINTTSSAQTKSGSLTVSDLTLDGNDLNFGYGARMSNTAFRLEISAGNANSDDLFLNAGTSQSDGGITLIGGGQIDLKPGNGRTRFLRASDEYVTAEISNGGTMTLKGDLIVGSDSTGDDDLITFDGTETLGWTNAKTRFEFSDEVAITGPLQVGSTGVDPVAYNRFGTGSPSASGDLGASNDVLVSGDLEVGDVAYVSRSLVVGDSTPTSNQAFSSFGEPIDVLTDVIKSGEDVFVAHNLQVNGTRFSPGWFSEEGHGAFQSIMYSPGWSFGWYRGGSASSDLLARLNSTGHLDIAGSLTEHYNFDIAESFLAGERLEPGDLVSISSQGAETVHTSRGAGDVTVLGVVSTSPGIVLGGAPFDPDTLGEIWGEGIRQEFLAARSRLRDEVRTTTPELQKQLREIEALEAKRASQPGATGQAFKPEAKIAKKRAMLDERIESEVMDRFFKERFVPVALAGRVPVKVDGSYGAILPGDALSPSPIPGVAMKSDGHGPVVGIALQAYEGGRGITQMFVQRDSASHESQARLSEAIDARTPDPKSGQQSLESDLQLVLDRPGNQDARFSIFRDGQTGGALDDEVFRVDEAGNIFAAGALHPNAMDLAEYFAVAEEVEAGDVLVADHETPGAFRQGRDAADPAVVGVVSTKPGVLLGGGVQQVAAASPELALELEEARVAGDRPEETRLWQEMTRRFRETHAPVAMTGTVPCKVDAGYGSIRVGDLLTVSPTAGHAMRADEPEPGTILGKALESLDSGSGLIRILVMMR